MVRYKILRVEVDKNVYIYIFFTNGSIYFHIVYFLESVKKSLLTSAVISDL